MVFENVGKGVDIYPCIGLRHSTDSVRVNFGHAPFKYAIEEHVYSQRNEVWANVQATRIDPDVLQGKAKVVSQQQPEEDTGPLSRAGALDEESHERG